MSNCCASSASVFSPFTAAKATFALKAGVWFRRGLLLIVSPDSQAPACPLSGRNSTYRAVRNCGATSNLDSTILVLNYRETQSRQLATPRHSPSGVTKQSHPSPSSPAMLPLPHDRPRATLRRPAHERASLTSPFPSSASLSKHSRDTNLRELVLDFCH